MKPTTLADYDSSEELGIDKITNNNKASISDDSLALSQPRKPVIKDSSEFNLDNFTSFINKVGLLTQWEQSFVCPCVNPMTNQPDPSCPICHGTGRGYLPAVTNVKIAIQSNDKGFTRTPFGTFDQGSSTGTVQIGYKVSTWDRITVPDATVRQQYMFNVSESRLSTGKYIPYDVKEMLYVAAMKPSEPKTFHELIPNIDYTFNRDTNVLKVNSSLLGYNITLLATVTLRYIVYNVPKELRYQYTATGRENNPIFTEMPRLISLKREEIFINNIPLVNPSDNQLTTKADIDSLPSSTNNDEGFGL